MILTRTQAAVALVRQWERDDDRAQALVDFLNDLGGRVAGGRFWCQDAEIPTPGTTYHVERPVSLHYVEETPAGLNLRRDTCDQAQADRLHELDAGVGVLSIQAQLLRHRRRDPESVSSHTTP